MFPAILVHGPEVLAAYESGCRWGQRVFIQQDSQSDAQRGHAIVSCNKLPYDLINVPSGFKLGERPIFQRHKRRLEDVARKQASIPTINPLVAPERLSSPGEIHAEWNRIFTVAIVV